MSLQNIQERINRKTATIGIIGLGYVGLPVACVCSQAGFKVIGIDIKPDRVSKIMTGESPIEGNEPGLAELLAEVVSKGKFQASTDYNLLSVADVVLIAVDTPVDQFHKPQYTALRSAITDLGRVLTKDTLVIIESTVAPGTVNTLIKPILEVESGLTAEKDLFLGICPERVMPGKLLSNLRSMHRVCGGDNPNTVETMVMFYQHMVEADLDTADIITAELVKTTENAYRDVQIAFANEVAKICEVNGADAWRVRELVNKSPSRQMHLPGAGVGGHCIPKDSWLLAYSSGDQLPFHLIPAARTINDSMPKHVANMVVQALTKAGQVVTQARVGVLGYAYLENSDDTRHSPTASMVAHLHTSVSEIYIHDPWVRQYQGDVYERVNRCHALVLMVKHDEYRFLDLSRLKATMRTPILIDGRGFFNPGQLITAGFSYWGVGRGRKSP